MSHLRKGLFIVNSGGGHTLGGTPAQRQSASYNEDLEEPLEPPGFQTYGRGDEEAHADDDEEDDEDGEQAAASDASAVGAALLLNALGYDGSPVPQCELDDPLEPPGFMTY
jgi:hypothetical protein